MNVKPSAGSLLRLVLFTAFLIMINESASAQDYWWKDKKYKNDAARVKYELCKKTFKDIGLGLSTGNVNLISQYVSSLVYIDIAGNENGYYSPSQAEIILSDFMAFFTVDAFSYRSSSRYTSNAFAKGTYKYRKGGGRRELDATVSLKYKNGLWHLDQISIN